MVGESRCAGLGLTLGCEGDEVALPVAAHASQSPAATPRRSPRVASIHLPGEKGVCGYGFKNGKRGVPLAIPRRPAVT